MFGKAKTLMELKKLQSQLAKEVVEVEAGDGAVKIQISGEQKVKKVILDPAKLDQNDTAKLEHWLESAITQAITKSQQIAAEKMKSLSGGLGIPGL
ncbi:YbaB/EbfC family nucleoid-associated protein [Candidatus Microgenomates bacterium]|nr:YbaB/EbfC family nucleoid-associated protein [Candidatus Microgenomates bacterium]